MPQAAASTKVSRCDTVSGSGAASIVAFIVIPNSPTLSIDRKRSFPNLTRIQSSSFSATPTRRSPSSGRRALPTTRRPCVMQIISRAVSSASTWRGIEPSACPSRMRPAMKDSTVLSCAVTRARITGSTADSSTALKTKEREVMELQVAIIDAKDRFI